MRSKNVGKTLGVMVSGLLLCVGAAWGQSPSSKQVRGTVESVQGNKLTVQSYSGKTMNVHLQSSTKYVWVKKASLSDILPNDYLGVASTGPKNHMKATEVTIFPNSMRGAGEGHYRWSMPAAVARSDEQGSGGSSTMTNGAMTNGAMTNGTMTNAKMTNAKMTNGAMTNGTMTNAKMTNGAMTNGNMTNGRMLTLSYHGQKVHVAVPHGTPVVRLVPAQKSALSQGAKVFVVASHANGMLDAKMVAVGSNGLMPPM